MKKQVIWALALSIVPFFTHAQVQFGVRAGLSTPNLDKETIDQNGLNLAILDANYGFHLGLFSRFPLGEKLYLQPELLFNSNTVDFNVTDMSEGLVNTVLNEKYQNLDIPFMLGYKIGPLRLEAGPVGHVFIASKSELDDELSTYDQRFNDFNLGYQTGVGLDIWRLLVDVRYEGSFSNFGEHMQVGGEQIRFSQNPSRWVMTVGLAF